jgi:chromosomal replication initiation ATPase DnaA
MDASLLWQNCYNELRLLREQLDRVTAVVARLNPSADPSFHTDRAEQVQKWICVRLDVRYVALIGKSREGRFVRPRWLAMWLIRKYCDDLSLNAIGSMFGGRDHGTVLNAINCLEDGASVDPAQRKVLDDLDAACRAFLAERHLLPADAKAA